LPLLRALPLPHQLLNEPSQPIAVMRHLTATEAAARTLRSTTTTVESQRVTTAADLHDHLSDLQTFQSNEKSPSHPTSARQTTGATAMHQVGRTSYELLLMPVIMKLR
jgi:hypothetical protein